MQSDLYTHLLRDVKTQQFGANLSSIIKLRKENNQMKKLIVFFNGEEQAPLDVSSVDLKITDDGTLILNIESTPTQYDVTAGQKDATPVDTLKDAPSAKGIIQPSDNNEIFLLQGEALEIFKDNSVIFGLRKPENIIKEKNDTVPLTVFIIESNAYNIQDMESVKKATTDLIHKEKDLITKGFKTFKVETPQFIFTDENNFKLAPLLF